MDFFFFLLVGVVWIDTYHNSYLPTLVQGFGNIFWSISL